MSSRARAKRRGHVQQYSTGGDGSQPNASNGPPTTQVPVAPLASIPRPGVVFANTGANPAGAEPDNGTAANWTQSGDAGKTPRVPNAYSTFATEDLQMDDQKDPWDEEIGEIPWEDENPQESPGIQETQGTDTKPATESGALNSDVHGNTHATDIQPSEPLAADDDLEDLPWEEDHVQEEWPQKEQMHDEYGQPHSESALPWEQVSNSHHGSQNPYSWQNQLDDPGKDKPESRDANVDEEVHNWDPEASSLPWESTENAENNIAANPEGDFWGHENIEDGFGDQETAAEEYSAEPIPEPVTENIAEHIPEKTHDLPGNGQDENNEETSTNDVHEEYTIDYSVEAEDENHTENAEFLGHENAPHGEFPWENETSHRSFLDYENMQTLNFQESDHPPNGAHSEKEHSLEEENWDVEADNGYHRSFQSDLHSDLHGQSVGQNEAHEVDQEDQFGPETEIEHTEETESLLPSAIVEPEQSETPQWDRTMSTHQNIEHTVQSILFEENSHNENAPTSWPSVENRETTADDRFAGHVATAELANQSIVEDSDVTTLHLTQSNHELGDDKRAKALELLDMDDDLLLDDDFLEDEEIAPVSEPAVSQAVAQTAPAIAANAEKPKSSFASKYAKPAENPQNAQNPQISQYAPSRNSYAPPPASSIIPTKPAAVPEPVLAITEHKKNDAYDFPVEFAPHKAKPATRAASTNLLPKVTPVAPVAATQSANIAPSSVTENAANATKKPFFEDLPVALPKPSTKPKRAAPAATTVPQPPAPQEPVSLPKRSPKNPYASLAPKVGLSQQPQVQGPSGGPGVLGSGGVFSGPGVPGATGILAPGASGVSDRNGTPTKYQPAGTPVGRPPQQSNTPPVKSGVVPPSVNVPMGNTQMGPGVPANKYATGIPAGNQYAPGPVPGSQVPMGNQYSQMGNQYSQMGNQQPQIGNQYSQMGNQPPSMGNQQPPIGNQYAPGPLPVNPQAPIGNQQPQLGNQYAHTAPNQYAQAVQPSQFAPAPVTQHGQNPVPTTFPEITHTVNRAPRVNTNVARTSDKNSLSPYVPDTGPYGPSARTHSRTSSLIGGSAREGNPYAPVHQGAIGALTSPNHALAPVNTGVRKRGKSNARSSLPTISQVAEKVENPEALLRRQFPIFTWGPSDQAAVFISQPGNGFEMPHRVVRVAKVSEVVPSAEVHAEFPGPLSKSKSKRKEIEAWLEKNIAKLRTDFAKSDELLLSELLHALVQNDGEFASKALHQKWAAILTPNVDFSMSQDPNSGFTARSGPGISANAFKLDNAGINTVWALVQAGNREGALHYAISKQDWAFSFIIAQSLGQETFSKVCSDYARMMFPFQTNQNTRVQHLMPLLLKIFVGNSKSVIEDFTNVPSEAEFAKTHYREIISAAIINGASTEFLVEFGHFLGKSGLAGASETCFLVAGLVLSRVPLQNGAVFSTVGSFTSTSVYSEIYEYVLSVLSTSASIPPTGLPDLLPVKIKRAQILADIGYFTASRKYCDHIGSVMKSLGKSPYITQGASSDFKNLLVRLSDSSSSESGWLGGKLSKVNLDKVWGQLDKFIGGDDTSSKPGEKGVFSKFSPNISRKSSMLDVTATTVHRSESYLGPPQITSAPPTEFSSPQRNSRPTMPQKYAPSLSNQSQTMSQPPMMGSQTLGKAGRYHPQNGSSSSVNLADAVKDGAQGTLPVKPAVGRNSIYAHRAGQLSSSSIASQNMGLAPGIGQKARSSVSHEKGHVAVPRSVNGHSRTSSHQSEILEPHRSPVSIANETAKTHPAEVPEKIKESPREVSYDAGLEEGSVSSNSDEEAPEGVILEKDEDKESNHEDLGSKEPVQPPPVSKVQTAPKRANPYAPNEARKGNKGSNRYGPGAASGNKYKFQPKAIDEKLAGISSGTPFSDMLSDDTRIQEHEAERVVERQEGNGRDGEEAEVMDEQKDEEKGGHKEEKRDEEKTDITAVPPSFNKVPRTHAKRIPQEKRNPYAPVKQTANVDISFDAGHEETETEPEVEEPRPLILTGPVSPPAFKPGFVNPYQEGKKASNETPIQSGFDEFPIPGSPEYTTRANSVIGHTGLYSSRLSQSQQSALYQQYEVKDDTVLDYVPVPEENDDETKKEARKKDMADAKQKIQEEMSRRGGGQNAESGWFKGWLANKKNDDKPKPIRAKLGKANTFKYDETHKRWIDTSRPLEEQLKESAPPPPPKKKVQEKPQEAPAIAAPAPRRGPSAVPSTIGGRRTSVSKTPAKADPETPRPNLANAGLDDLLNLNPANKGPAGRRGKRRYVNVMETK